MQKNLMGKIRESLGSVLPVAAIVFLLMLSIVPVSGEMFFMFFIGTIMLVVGIGLFTLGADTSMIIIGEEIGAKLVRLKKIWLILPVCFIIGILVTVAEPDLKVLADQTPIVESQVMIWAVGIGVGVFLSLAFLRIFLQIKISVLFVILYAFVFIFACSPLISSGFIPTAFDSGGVASGPLTATFLLPLAMGASFAAGGNMAEDAFGIVAMVAMTPLLTIQILGLISKFKTAPKTTAIEGQVFPIKLDAACDTVVILDNKEESRV